ncbi:MAG: ROK family protein [Trueperaceae bacterium]|nr:ROK family protein [Trueperaceae bacterium]
MAKKSPILGIDVGGSGIKAALVDVSKGELVSDRHRIATPQPSTPEAVADVIAQMVKHFDYQGNVGCTMPGVVQHGVLKTAANIDKSWVDTDANKLFSEATGCPVSVMNDADAAGIAEVTFGAGKEQRGVILVLTFGTGIGSALFVNGHLVPNAELGHLEYKGYDTETRMSAKIKEDKKMSYKKWGKLVNGYLQYLEFLFSPDMFVIGGGISKKSDKFFPYFETKAKVVTANLLNEAGIVGAAYAVSQD